MEEEEEGARTGLVDEAQGPLDLAVDVVRREEVAREAAPEAEALVDVSARLDAEAEDSVLREHLGQERHGRRDHLQGGAHAVRRDRLRREHRRVGRQRPARARERVLGDEAVGEDAVEVRRRRPRVTVRPEAVGPQHVDVEEDHDAARAGGGAGGRARVRCGRARADREERDRRQESSGDGERGDAFQAHDPPSTLGATGEFTAGRAPLRLGLWRIIRAPMDAIVIRGAREHNLKNVSLSIPRNALVVLTGVSGLGEVLARVRHALRRGPAALRRVPLGVRAAVPRADGEARRRLDRGALARDLDRAEDDVEEPALDRRDGHGDLRLPPAPLRVDRQAPLPDLRARDRGPDDPADGRPRPRDARGDEVPPPRPVRPRQEGRVPEADGARWSSRASCARA